MWHESNNPEKLYETAYECAVSHFKTQAVVALPFSMWLDVSSGKTIVVVRR